MKTLKQMLNEAGYKEYSEINPLILQSKVIQIIRVWLQQKRKLKELKLRELKKKFPMIELTDKTPLDVELLLSEINVFLELLEDLDK